jgi:hypothetical protein
MPPQTVTGIALPLLHKSDGSFLPGRPHCLLRETQALFVLNNMAVGHILSMLFCTLGSNLESIALHAAIISPEISTVQSSEQTERLAVRDWLLTQHLASSGIRKFSSTASFEKQNVDVSFGNC